MADKPRSRPTGNTPKPPAHKGSDAGTMGLDDRGNVTWEWKDEGDLLADDTLGAAERVRALVDPRLKVTDDDDDPGNPISVEPERPQVRVQPLQQRRARQADVEEEKESSRALEVDRAQEEDRREGRDLVRRGGQQRHEFRERGDRVTRRR